MSDKENIWYSNGDLLSKNRLFSFVIGNRGGGKTFGFQKWALNDFLKNGNKFIWLRRYGSEIKEIKGKWCPPSLMKEFPNNTITFNGNNIYIDKKHCGTMIALSTSTRVKSVAYEEYDKIIFDEFLIDKGSLRYISSETDLYLDFFETVARLRDNVRGIFIANAISIVNPYFTKFNIKPNLDNRFTLNKHVCVELYKNDNYIQAKKKTRYGDFINGTDYGDYAIDNKFLRDDYSFIQPIRPQKLVYSLTLKYKGLNMGVWLEFGSTKSTLYIDNIIEKDCERCLSVTLDDLDENSKFKNYVGLKAHISQLKFMFSEGNILFNNLTIKKAFFEVIKII